jgi:hypothetical protein
MTFTIVINGQPTTVEISRGGGVIKHLTHNETISAEHVHLLLLARIASAAEFVASTVASGVESMVASAMVASATSFATEGDQVG